MTEDRSQKAEGGIRKAEVGKRNAEVGREKTRRTEVEKGDGRSQKTDVRNQITEDGRRNELLVARYLLLVIGYLTIKRLNDLAKPI